ncbi:hypothetical protein MMC08_009103, partial [Hypocenomyce scalaris]|nr:hypothetical protein [Hypocenomyce scalaris]
MSPTSSTSASYGSSSNAYPTEGTPASNRDPVLSRDPTSDNHTPMQRWAAASTPGAEPWSSVSYHARNPDDGQRVQANPAANQHRSSSCYSGMQRWQPEGPQHELWNSAG